jgi:putative aldouronate transport system permease protein
LEFGSKSSLGKRQGQGAGKRVRLLLSNIMKNYQLYLLILPAITVTLIFHYFPIYGVQIAFRNFKSSLGILGSQWVGLKYFIRFVTYLDFWRIVKNTLAISLYTLATFPCAVIFALLLNEVTRLRFKKTVQMITYAPHFISAVVIVALLRLFLARENGLFNNISDNVLGSERVEFLNVAEYFSSIYVWSGVWQDLGWGSIIYLAALSGLSPELIEASKVDGANRFQIIWHISLPHLMPTIITMLILSTGTVLSVGFEKIYLMQTPLNLDSSNVISTYVYDMGIVNNQLSYSAAIGLFNNVINVIVIVLVNMVCKKVTNISLW